MVWSSLRHEDDTLSKTPLLHDNRASFDDNRRRAESKEKAAVCQGSGKAVISSIHCM